MKTLFVPLACALAVALAARAETELSVTLEGGGVKYDQALSSSAGLGAEYGLRLGILPTPILGLEVGYLGSRSSVGSTRLVSNGAYADARVNFLPGRIAPYVFGGVGLTSFKVDNEIASTEAGLHGRTVSTIPFGAGLDVGLGRFKIGGRFQYNYLLTDQLYRSAPAGNGVQTGNNTNLYGFSIDLGASFR